jgi:hypothetical protein
MPATRFPKSLTGSGRRRRRLSFVVCRLSFVVCRLSFVVCRLSFVVCRLSFVVCRLSFVVCRRRRCCRVCGALHVVASLVDRRSVRPGFGLRLRRDLGAAVRGGPQDPRALLLDISGGCAAFYGATPAPFSSPARAFPLRSRSCEASDPAPAGLRVLVFARASVACGVRPPACACSLLRGCCLRLLVAACACSLLPALARCCLRLLVAARAPACCSEPPCVPLALPLVVVV